MTCAPASCRRGDVRQAPGARHGLMPRTAWAGLGARRRRPRRPGSASRPRHGPAAWGVGALAARAAGAGSGWPGPPRAPASAVGATTVGAALILLRLALGCARAARDRGRSPCRRGRWTGRRPWRACRRRPARRSGRWSTATAADAGVSLRLWLLLPRYPDVVPGDRIRFRAPPRRRQRTIRASPATSPASARRARRRPQRSICWRRTGGPAAALERCAV